MSQSNSRHLGASLALSSMFLASALVYACSSDGGGDEIVPFTPADGGTLVDATIPPIVLPDGATVFPGLDASVNGGQDGGPEADAGSDGGSDAATGDASADGGSDAGPDDAGMDAGSDAGPDAGPDTGLDAGSDAGMDAGSDAGLDAGGDAGVDASLDAGPDGGYPYVRGTAPTADTASKAGPYTVRTYTNGLRTTAAFSGGTVYYPTDAAAPYAIAVIVPDLFAARTTVAGWGTFLASHGIVTMTADPASAFDLGGPRATTLADALTALRTENTRSGSPLNGKLDGQHAAVLGWGWGADGALAAAASASTLSAVVSLADSDDVTYDRLAVPTEIISAENDTNQAASTQIYTAIPNTTPKLLLQLNNQGHAAPSDPTNVSGVVGRFGLSWLKTFLEGDTRYRPFLLSQPSQASDYRTNLR